MEATEREHYIIDSLLEKGSVTVAGLSRGLDVSEVTIRSDLNALEKRGVLSRVHGGAVPSIHPHILERQNLRTEEKLAIARAAAALVEDGDTIMVEAGTTPALLCRFLGGKRDVHVITNSVLAFTAAKTNRDLKITLAGGEFRAATESFVGPIARETIQRFNVRFAFIGSDGFSAARGITTRLLEGGEIIKVMKDKARETVLLADSTKFGQAGLATILPLSGLDAIITDAHIPANAAAAIKSDRGIKNIREIRDGPTAVFYLDKGQQK